MNTLSVLLCLVLLPLVLNEFAEWCPWLAEQLVLWSARQLDDAEARTRYEEEYIGNLAEVPGKVSKLLAAFTYAANVPRMRQAEAGPTERSAQDIPAGFSALY